jgi:hypothetical protein
MPAKPQSIDLVKLFGTVASTLATNKDQLNQADTYNHDHGDNMVEIFEVITQAMKDKKGGNPADQLAYASQILRQRQSGSAQMYARGLSQASKEFKGTPVTTENAMTLIQSLLGASQAPAQPQGGMGAGADLLGSLLGGMTGSQAAPQGQQNDPGLDLGDLLNAGMAYMNTKQQGGSDAEAIINALVQGSAVGSSSPHRSQSGTLVVNTLLQTINAMASRRK